MGCHTVSWAQPSPASLGWPAWAGTNICETPGLCGERPRASLTKETGGARALTLVGRAGQERPAATPTPRVSEGGGELSEGERGGEKKG